MCTSTLVLQHFCISQASKLGILIYLAPREGDGIGEAGEFAGAKARVWLERLAVKVACSINWCFHINHHAPRTDLESVQMLRLNYYGSMQALLRLNY